MKKIYTLPDNLKPTNHHHHNNVHGSLMNGANNGSKSQQNKYVDWKKFKNKMKPDLESLHIPTSFHNETVDYLKGQREKREYEGLNHDIIYIEKKLNDEKIQDTERLQLITQKAQYLENKAKMEEEFLKNTESKNIEDEMAINDRYLDLITAKLKLLNRI